MKRKFQQKNVKFYIKKNIISFLIGIIIFGGVGVYAAVTFPSNDVTYDNTESGLKSKDVQGAIDELYTECTKEPSAGETIIENAGLEKDPYECRYFFTGANPNNYITFNDEKAKWRIISVECDGTIKIMRNAGIGEMAWDNQAYALWDRPSSLNEYLNNTYLSKLSSTSQTQINSHDFKIGKATRNSNNIANQINEEGKNIWHGKIALPTASEYIRVNSNIDECGTSYLNMSNRNTCKNTNWMFNNDSWWTLTQDGDLSSGVFTVDVYGKFTYMTASLMQQVRPTLYLSSEIKITGGTGTSSDPYQISL